MSVFSKVVIIILLLANSLVWLAVKSFPDDNLHIIACDVGQGDAILITYGTTQVLIDGGPNDRVLECISRHIPFWDREIEIMILTHPEADHYTGLITIARRYKVGHFVATRLSSSNEDYQVLENTIESSRTNIVNATDRTDMRVGDMVIDVIHPTQDHLDYGTDGNVNNYSIVLRLAVGEFDALFTGDIGPEVIDELLATGKVGDVEYLKVPHHGSMNGLTPELLRAVEPEVAVIPVGKNSWGHPHKEVLNMLSAEEVDVFRTDTDGDVEMVTDGISWWVVN